MLEKTLYNQLFKHFFSNPDEVTFWDGSVKEYGNTRVK